MIAPLRHPRLKAGALVLAVWAAVYLPKLGSLELRGEEPRRAMVAANMLASGDFIVPSIAGEDYYNKPPGLNWLIALSFRLAGDRSELAARLPSVLLIVAFALMLVLTRAPWLKPRSRLLAALIWLTMVSLIDRGRMIEIDPPYACLTGMALLWWLNLYSRGGSRWAMWLVAGAFLALGALIKGPILGIVFYLTVGLVLLRQRRLRELAHPAHLAGVGLILLLCLGWVALAAAGTSAEKMGAGWSQQWTSHLIPKHVEWEKWALRVGGAIAGLGFWALFLPLLWLKRFSGDIRGRRRDIFEACHFSLLLCFMLLNAFPATRPRYSMPLYPLAAMLLGCVLAMHRRGVRTDAVWKWFMLAALVVNCATAAAGLVLIEAGFWPVAALAVAVGVASVAWRNRDMLIGGYRLSLLTAGACAALAMTACVHLTPLAVARETRRPLGRLVGSLVPEGETIHVYRGGYEPVLYYVREPLAYLHEPDAIDADVRYLLLATAQAEKPEVENRIEGHGGTLLCTFPGRFGEEYRLLRIGQ